MLKLCFPSCSQSEFFLSPSWLRSDPSSPKLYDHGPCAPGDLAHKATRSAVKPGTEKRLVPTKGTSQLLGRARSSFLAFSNPRNTHLAPNLTWLSNLNRIHQLSELNGFTSMKLAVGQKINFSPSAQREPEPRRAQERRCAPWLSPRCCSPGTPMTQDRASDMAISHTAGVTP